MVFEPTSSGHHFAYLRLVLPALKELSAELILATSEGAPESEEFKQLLAPIADGLHIDASATRARRTPIAAARAGLANLQHTVQRHRPDYLYIAYADGLSQLVGAAHLVGRAGFLKGFPSEAVFFRGGFAYKPHGLRNRAKAELSWRLAQQAPWTSTLHIDPIVFDAVQRRGGRAAQRMLLLPDPVDAPQPISTAEARRSLGIPDSGRCIGTAGILDSRKGVDLLVRAFAQADLREDDRLLLVGHHSEPLRAMLQGEFAPLIASRRIISLDRFVSQEEFLAAIAAMDVVCTPYPAHIGSASIVIRAAAAGKPVLGGAFGWIGAMVGRFSLGWVCNVREEAEFARAIAAALDSAPAFKHGEAARRFVRFHTPENFIATYTRRLRQRLGRTGPGDHPDWGWVCSVAANPPADAATGTTTTQRAGA